MPSYPWLEKKKVDFYGLRRKFSVMKTLGVPYSDETVANADKIAEQQATQLAAELTKEIEAAGGSVPAKLEQMQITALIAYLQALGKKGKQ